MQTAARGIALSSRGSSSSAPSFKRVLTEISNAMLGSNTQWRGKSFAASVPSGSFKPQKGQKRIPKQERHAMVESFVDKYRASNAGRFPTSCHVHKEIGGSYYIVRQIVQELEYKYKVSSSSKIEVVRLGKAKKIICPSSGVKKKPSVSEVEDILSSTTEKVKSSTELLDSIKIDEYQLVKDDELIVHLEAKEEPPVSDNAEKFSVEDPTSPTTTVTNPLNEQVLEVFGGPSISSAQINIEVHEKDVPSSLTEQGLQDDGQDSSGGRESKASTDITDIAQADLSVSLKSEVTVETPSSPTGVIEGSQKDITATEDLQDAHDPGLDLSENHGVRKHEEFNGDHPRRLERGESSTKATGFWGNLKSFADGIITFWKKM